MEIKSPMTFKEFAKNPIVAVLFLCLLAIAFMYKDMKGSVLMYTDSQDRRISLLEYRDSIKSKHIKHCDSSVAALNEKFNYLQAKNKVAVLATQNANRVEFVSTYK
jgi:hypothetical protein